MSKYLVHNVSSGHVFGVYEGNNAAQAICAMMADAGASHEAQNGSVKAEPVDVSPDRLLALRREAGEAGDAKQVALCDRALDGDPEALTECALVFIYAGG